MVCGKVWRTFCGMVWGMVGANVQRKVRGMVREKVWVKVYLLFYLGSSPTLQNEITDPRFRSCLELDDI